MTIHRAVIVLALGLGLVGCAARQPAESEASAPASTGGESARPADVTDADGESEGGAYHGGSGAEESEPSMAREDAETLDAVTAYDALRSVETDYDALLDSGSSDCPEAERLVQRICYLAERVCGLEGVDAQASDTEGAARCDEGRARCARSEARLARTCP